MAAAGLSFSLVVPAKAGTHMHRTEREPRSRCVWMPAFAGMRSRGKTAAL